MLKSLHDFWSKATRYYDLLRRDFISRAQLLVTMGVVCWLLITLALFIPLWEYREHYTSIEMALIVILCCLFGVFFYRASQYCIDDVKSAIEYDVTRYGRDWLKLGLAQYLVVFLIVSLITASPFRLEVFAIMLLILVSPQLAVYQPPVPTMGWALLANIPLLLATVDFSAFAVFVLLAIFHGILIVVVSSNVGEQKALRTLLISNSQLRAAKFKLSETARHAERLRISRDLHDKIGHQLVALSIQLEIASHLVEGRALEEIENSKRQAKALLDDVRRVVGELRVAEPVSLSHEISRMRDKLRVVVPQLSIEAEISRLESRLPRAILEELSNITQEALTNTLKHAHAKRFHVSLSIAEKASDYNCILTIHDDGDGVDIIREGHGLQGIRERAKMLDGTAVFSSAPNKGFVTTVKLFLVSNASYMEATP